MPNRTIDDTTALDLMAELLTGREWSIDDLAEVAAIIRETGREIAEPNE